MIKAMLWVTLGGGLGALGRFLITTWLFVPGRFPWATLIINIAGAFAIGLLWGVGQQQAWFDQWGRYLLVVGVLGGFTTFSAFSLRGWRPGAPRLRGGECHDMRAHGAAGPAPFRKLIGLDPCWT